MPLSGYLTHWGRGKMAHISQTTFSNAFENVWISLKVSLTFVLKFRMKNTPSLVQIMVWRRPSMEPMMVSLPTHIFVTWPHWMNSCSDDVIFANDRYFNVTGYVVPVSRRSSNDDTFFSAAIRFKRTPIGIWQCQICVGLDVGIVSFGVVSIHSKPKSGHKNTCGK